MDLVLGWSKPDLLSYEVSSIHEHTIAAFKSQVNLGEFVRTTGLHTCLCMQAWKVVTLGRPGLGA